MLINNKLNPTSEQIVKSYKHPDLNRLNAHYKKFLHETRHIHERSVWGSDGYLWIFNKGYDYPISARSYDRFTRFMWPLAWFSTKSASWGQSCSGRYIHFGSKNLHTLIFIGWNFERHQSLMFSSNQDRCNILQRPYIWTSQ